MPLLIPHSWRISIAVTLIFPVIGMIADKRRHGRVHPAWWWSVGAIIVVQIAADIIAYRSEEHTSELQSLMRISYAVFCSKKKKTHIRHSRPLLLHQLLTHVRDYIKLRLRLIICLNVISSVIY